MNSEYSKVEEFPTLPNIYRVWQGKHCGILDSGVIVIPVAYAMVFPPIHCSRPLYACQKAYEGWMVITPSGEIVVPVGKYFHLWGYDNDLCLFSLNKSFGSRGIMGIDGKEVLKSGSYKDIWRFYGIGSKTIRCVDWNDKGVLLDRQRLEVVGSWKHRNQGANEILDSNIYESTTVMHQSVKNIRQQETCILSSKCI